MKRRIGAHIAYLDGALVDVLVPMILQVVDLLEPVGLLNHADVRVVAKYLLLCFFVVVADEIGAIKQPVQQRSNMGRTICTDS